MSRKIWFFTGCMASLRKPEIAEATVKILDHCGVEYKIFEDEPCCGSILLRTGQYEKAKKIEEENTALFRKLGVERLVTSCPGCYRTLKNDYTLLSKSKVKVLHFSELANLLVTKGILKFHRELPLKATFHDPCHLGRHCGVYDAPRNVLRSIPGLKLEEMPRSREFSRCCGAGGGVLSAFKDMASAVAKARIIDARDVRAEVLVTSCPFCNYVLGMASEEEKGIKVWDLTELVLKAMGLEG